MYNFHLTKNSKSKFQIPGNRNGRIFSLENLLERIMIQFFFHRKEKKREKIQIPIPRLDEERRGWQRRARRRCSRNEIIARSGCFSHWPAFIRNIAHNILPPS